MATLAQPRRGRRQSKRLPAQLIRGNQNDVHFPTSIAARRADAISVIIEDCFHWERIGRMAINAGNSFRTRDKLNVGAQTFEVHRLELLEKQGVAELAKLPFSLRILLENLLRFEDGRFVHAEDI